MKHEWPVKPMSHQVEAVKLAWGRRAFGLFHEMGTGKTFTTINLAVARYNLQKINSLVVVCPTSLKDVWEDEFSKFCKVPYDLHIINAGNFKTHERWVNADVQDKLRVLVVGVEALSQGNAFALCRSFIMSNRPTMTVVDESSTLKNPTSIRTKKCITLGLMSEFTLALTGTPITQGIHDLYGQFSFLDPNIIGCKSWVLFRNRYCVMGGFEGRNIVGYQNVDSLMERLRPYSHIVRKEDVMDLPPKVYERITVELTNKQLELIKQLKDTEEANQGDKNLIAATMLERMTRFQQIVGGHFPFNEEDLDSKKLYGVEPVKGRNPKMDALMSSIDTLDNKVKVIIWARFTPEIELIKDCLESRYGEVVSTFYGKTPENERKSSVDNFRYGDHRFMVSNQAVGGMGQTWIEASYVYYYSNSFSYQDRAQSEDRAHRKGQNKSVTYIDIEANHHYDRMILKAVRVKGGLARMVSEELSDGA
jgi:SNF2 family DNA or RNA helicase